ncbi:MAG: hypothetical protein JXN65_08405 [Clostridia bacterium]|nr:hypothetical protein [Clostridia bacterium]
MKKLILIICFVSLFFGACKETPNKEVVVGKGEEGLEEMLELAGVNQEGLSAGKIDKDVSYYTIPSTMYKAPEIYKNYIEYENYGMNIEADVIVPEYALPIVEVQIEKLSFETISEFINMTTGSEDLYSIDLINEIETKDTIQASIDGLLNELEYLSRPYEEIYNPSDPITQENVNELIKSINQRISELSIKLETAPETFEEAISLLKDKGEFETETGVKIYPSMLEPKEITSSNYDSIPCSLGAMDSYCNYTYYYIDAENKYNQQLHFKTRKLNYSDMPFGDTTADEAITFAQPYVELLGDRLVVAGVEEDEVKYEITYMRMYCGIKSALMFSSPSDISYLGSTERPYKQEQLVIQVSKKIPMYIQGIDYYSPLAVSNVVTRDAKLLPFDEITEIQERCGTIHTFDSESKVEITINRIQLEVIRVRKPNAEGEFIIIPVWNFYGTETRTWNGLERTAENQNEYQTYLTINAIDGSIIDMHKQY